MGIKRDLREKEQVINRKNRHAERFNQTLEEKKKETIEKVTEKKILKGHTMPQVMFHFASAKTY